MGLRHLEFRIAEELRSVSRKWWLQLYGPRPEPGFRCDGCSFSPDAWRQYKLWPACVIHDYHYRTGVVGGGARARMYADTALLLNLRKCLEMQRAPWWLHLFLPYVYWGRVRIWGASSFRFTPGTEPMSWWARVKEVWG